MHFLNSGRSDDTCGVFSIELVVLFNMSEKRDFKVYTPHYYVSSQTNFLFNFIKDLFCGRLCGFLSDDSLFLLTLND